MAAQKTLERLIQREEREEGARVREDHHKAGERPGAVADPDRPKRAPVDLGLFGGQRGQAAIDASAVAAGRIRRTTRRSCTTEPG